MSEEKNHNNLDDDDLDTEKSIVTKNWAAFSCDDSPCDGSPPWKTIKTPEAIIAAFGESFQDAVFSRRRRQDGNSTNVYKKNSMSE